MLGVMVTKLPSLVFSTQPMQPNPPILQRTQSKAKESSLVTIMSSWRKGRDWPTLLTLDRLRSKISMHYKLGLGGTKPSTWMIVGNFPSEVENMMGESHTNPKRAQKTCKES